MWKIGEIRPVDELLKDLLMTAFERGPKTLQRWFAAGLVPNSRRTRGGARGGNYRIKTPTGTRRDHVVLWKKMLFAQHKQRLGRSLRGPMGIVLYDGDEYGFPESFRLWCIRAQDQIGSYMSDHKPGRRWGKASPASPRRRSLRPAPGDQHANRLAGRYEVGGVISKKAFASASVTGRL